MRTVLWIARARADLGKLDPTGAKRIYAAVHQLADTGEGNVKALHGALKGAYRLRVGPWRVHFDRPTPDAVRIHRIEKRGDAYRD